MVESPFDLELKVGTVEKAEDFSEAEKPQMAKLSVSIGEEEFQSAAQTGYNYEPKELEGR